MKNYQAIGLSTLLVAANIVMDYFYPAHGVVGIPIVAAMTTCFIVFAARNINIIVAAILSYVFVGVNDIGIRLYGNGLSHPWGKDYIVLYYLFGVGMAFTLLIEALQKMKTVKWSTKTIALLLFAILSALHLQVLIAMGADIKVNFD